MDITLDELKVIAGKNKFNLEMVEKDYLVTRLLYQLKDIKGIYFKGGTAINKTILNHYRLSEDLDFSLNKNVKKVEKQIKKELKGTIFKKITHDKRVDKFIRLIVHYKLFHDKGTIFIDLNQRAKLISKPKKLAIKHFYKNKIPQFKVICLAEEEMIAEKIIAVCTRYKPRDYLDLYYLIKKNHPINLKLVKRKMASFNIPRMFKNTYKIYNTWDEDLFMLTKEKPSFEKVMKTLAEHFNLKKEKDKLKDQS